jgi:site-specific DNA-cytosine methylase
MAMKSLGIPCDYHSVEIDPHARRLADDNYEFEITRWQNDVTLIREEDIIAQGPYDIVSFGSPCQSVSVAGNGTGLDGKSGLLLNCMEILRWCQKQNPKLIYLIENVKMKKEFLQQFDDLIGGERILINSSLLSAQKRDRYYWTNFRVVPPEDKGILLRDILDSNADRNLFFEPKNLERITESRVCWDSAMKGNHSQADRAYSTDVKMGTVPAARTESKVNIYGFVDRDNSYCIDANDHKGTTLRQYIEKSRRQVVFAYSSSQRETCIEHRSNISGKSNTLTTGSGCSGGLKSATMVGNILDKEIVFRKLSVRECARLQTIPEEYSFNSVAKTHAYKGIGNRWTVDVIAHILSYGLGIKTLEGYQCL